MEIKINFGTDACAIPVSALHVGANALDLRLLILLASNPKMRDEFSASEAASILGCDEKSVEISLDFLVKSGLVLSREVEVSNVTVKSVRSENGATVTVLTDADMPHYTGRELKDLFASDTALSGLVDECQRILGKIFTPTEASRIIGLSEYHRLSHEYILLVMSYCVKIGKPSVPYAVKTAIGMFNDGIESAEELAAALEQKQKSAEYTGRLRTLLGIGSRALTAKEKRFFEEWRGLEIPFAMIVVAYEIAVDNTGSASMPYINKILVNWKEAGYKDEKDAIASLEEFKKRKKQESSSFNIDNFFEAALARSEEEYQKYKN